MANLNEISKEANLLAAMQEVLPIINANKTALGVSTVEYTALSNAVTAFASQFAAANAAKTAAKAAVVQKNLSKDQATDLMFGWGKKWRANPAISDNLLALLMVAPHETPGSFTPPQTPTDLVATPQADGQVKLKWKRGGNSQGVVFQIQFKKPGQTWKHLSGTERLNFTAQAVAGQEIQFRVYALKGNAASAPTMPVTVWPANTTNTLQVAA